jgi:dTDP-4-amino-4,6-dideoxygalactose transaminase
MNEPDVPFHRPLITPQDRDAVVRVLEGGWLTTGPVVQEFEQRFAEYVGASHAVAVNSATAALHLAMEALGVGRGDEVVVPTYTFAASAETVLYLGARPVLADVDPTTLNLSATELEPALTDQTRAVEIVHFGGLPANLRDVGALLGPSERRPSIPLVEDVAHTFPSPIASLGGRFAGTIGAAGAFSFYATKTITTGEGGMLVTDDSTVADRVRSMRLHGISRDAWKRYSATGTWYYEIAAAGFKYNLTDLAAALGISQLEQAASLKRARQEIARAYFVGFKEAAEAGRLSLPAQGEDEEHAWHLFVVRLGQAARPEDQRDDQLPGVGVLPEQYRLTASRRARLIEDLRRAGVGASVHFIPLHLHPLYRGMGYAPGQFPNAEAAYAAAVSLPIWPGMTSGQIDRVISTVNDALL